MAGEQAVRAGLVRLPAGPFHAELQRDEAQPAAEVAGAVPRHLLDVESVAVPAEQCLGHALKLRRRGGELVPGPVLEVYVLVC